LVALAVVLRERHPTDTVLDFNVITLTAFPPATVRAVEALGSTRWALTSQRAASDCDPPAYDRSPS
jgi:hypothetical protein